MLLKGLSTYAREQSEKVFCWENSKQSYGKELAQKNFSSISFTRIYIYKDYVKILLHDLILWITGRIICRIFTKKSMF